MYKDHEHVHKYGIECNNIILWKYMDIFKFLNLINTSSLFFSRSDCLTDKYEGLLSREELEERLYFDLTENTHLVNSLFLIYARLPKNSFVNCWHENPNESSLMWDTYSNTHGGIAIKTNLQKLKDSIIDDKDVLVSPIVYDRKKIHIGNIFTPLLHKREAFSGESELRLLHIPIEFYHGASIDDKMKSIYIKIDIETLIEEILIHPSCPEWIANTLSQTLKALGIDVSISKSKLYL